jgi:dTDP-glucose 4,6-dehydratase
MKVIVTGGAGFIGSNVLLHGVRRHPEASWVNADALTYAANLRSLAPLADHPRYRFERVDLADRDAVEDLLGRERPDLVVHFAAETHVDRSLSDPAAFVRANVEGTLRLLEAFRRYAAPGALFHHVSTDEVYGSLGDTGRFTEDSRYDPSSPYAASKAASDHLVRAYGRTWGLHHRVTSCSNNYGPRQFPEKLVPLMILNAVEGRPLPVYGSGVNVRDWLYVEDHCEAIWATIERGRPGATYNVGGRCERRNLDVVHAICDVVAEETGQSAAALRGRITFVPDRPGHDLRYAIDPARIEADCGWSPRWTFREGLRATVRWYLEERAWVDEVRSGAYRAWIAQRYGDAV